MAVSNLMSASSPYVHSNIYHVIDSVKNFFNEVDSNEIQKQIEDTVKIFENWIKELQIYEQELYSFCGVSDFQGLNAKLFGTNQEDKIKAAAISVILRSDVISRLVPLITKEQTEAILQVVNNASIDDFFPQGIDKITLSQTREVIRAALINAFTSAGYQEGGRITRIEAINALNNGKEINKKLNEDLKDWIGQAIVKNKRNNKIDQLAKSILKEKIGSFVIPKSTFSDTFIPLFREKLLQEQIVTTDNENLETIISQVSSELYSRLFEGKFLADLPNIIGQRGEGLLGYAMDSGENPALNIEVLSTGSKNEKEIVELLKEHGVNVVNSQMRDYGIKESAGAQSKSDMIITIHNDNGAKAFRVQSKDSLMRRLENDDVKRFDSVYQTIRMLDSNISSILELLQSRTIIGQNSIDTMAYYIANLIWFAEAGTYTRDGKAEKRNRGITGGLAGMQEAINRIISQGIQAFIGITIADNVEDNPINISASNIFYFLSARTLFPVSEVLKAAVDQMRGFTQTLFRLRFVIDTNSATFLINNPKDFLEAKLSAVGIEGFNSSGNYSNSGLLGIGRAQGSSIMGSATGHINFTFDIGKILSISSYVF